ncbi:MAG: hypothetical protein WKF94_05110 [Solirubrobacteraceae bacterium]
MFEIDAWHTHGNRGSFEGDRLRDEHYEDHGIRVRRVTDTRLHGEPDAVAARVRRALVVCPARFAGSAAMPGGCCGVHAFQPVYLRYMG